MMKPVLLLDVDGVVNTFSRRPTKIESHGFLRETVVRSDEETPRDLIFHPGNLEILLDMDDDFELVWFSDWNDQANTALAPVIGFPELPVLHLPKNQDGRLYDSDGVLWKTPTAVSAFSEGGEYSGRRFVWIDDSTRRIDRSYLNEVFGNDYHRLILLESCNGFTEASRRACMAWKAFSFVY